MNFKMRYRLKFEIKQFIIKIKKFVFRILDKLVSDNCALFVRYQFCDSCGKLYDSFNKQAKCKLNNFFCSMSCVVKYELDLMYIYPNIKVNTNPSPGYRIKEIECDKNQT